jgi:hypothetical protein
MTCSGRMPRRTKSSSTICLAKRKAALLRVESTHPNFEESDFACYSEDEIRRFAFDIRSLFLTDHAKHLAICTRCQTRLESWTKLVATNYDSGLATNRPVQMRYSAYPAYFQCVEDLCHAIPCSTVYIYR